MRSCIYEGHYLRRNPATGRNALQLPVQMLYLDLDETEWIFRGRWLWSCRYPAPGAVLRRDHIGDPGTALSDAVRDTVLCKTGVRPSGPVRLLTAPRCFGHLFNPMSFYYCHRAADDELEAVVACLVSGSGRCRQIHVIAKPQPPSLDDESLVIHTHKRTRFAWRRAPAALHDHAFDLSVPGRRCTVRVHGTAAGQRVGEAWLEMVRVPIATASLARLLVRSTVCGLALRAAVLLGGTRYSPTAPCALGASSL